VKSSAQTGNYALATATPQPLPAELARPRPQPLPADRQTCPERSEWIRRLNWPNQRFRHLISLDLAIQAERLLAIQAEGPRSDWRPT